MTARQLRGWQRKGLELYGPGSIPAAPYAAECALAHMNEKHHRRHRKYVLAVVLIWMMRKLPAPACARRNGNGK